MKPSEKIEAFLQKWATQLGHGDQLAWELALKVLQPMFRRLDKALDDDPERLKPYVREIIADLSRTFL